MSLSSSWSYRVTSFVSRWWSRFLSKPNPTRVPVYRYGERPSLESSSSPHPDTSSPSLLSPSSSSSTLRETRDPQLGSLLTQLQSAVVTRREEQTRPQTREHVMRVQRHRETRVRDLKQMREHPSGALVPRGYIMEDELAALVVSSSLSDALQSCQGLKQSAIDEKVLESIRSRMVGFEYVHEKFEDPIRAQVPSWAMVNDKGVQNIYPQPES